MPSDYLDYGNNLVFPPQEIKSQHELITAIERCEKLEKEIIALNKEYQAECNRADELEDSLQTSWQNESKLKKQLDIAIKALEEYANSDNWNTENVEGEYVFCFSVKYPWRFTQTALEQIKELDK